MASASAYAVLGITHPGTLPAPELMALLAEWSFVPVNAALVFMLLLTNDRELMGEHVNSRAFNVIAWATVGSMIVLTAAMLITQR